MIWRIICVYVCLLCQDTQINEFIVCSLFVCSVHQVIHVHDCEDTCVSFTFLLTKYIWCFCFCCWCCCCWFYCTCDKLINAYSLAHYEIYSSRHFFSLTALRLRARALNEKKMTRRINLIMHSRACVNKYIWALSIVHLTWGRDSFKIEWRIRIDMMDISPLFLVVGVGGEWISKFSICMCSLVLMCPTWCNYCLEVSVISIM